MEKEIKKDKCNCGEECDCKNEECNCDEHSSKEKRKDKKGNKKNDKELEELNKTIIDLQTKLMYAQADSINYRKRKDEETANLLKFANQDLIVDLLDMIDNLDRASSSKAESDEAKKIQTGIEMISNQFKEILKKYGVVEIEALGYPFDSNYMEAMMVDSISDKPDDMVLEVLRKGYKYKERVIKPAVVKVNKIEN